MNFSLYFLPICTTYSGGKLTTNEEVRAMTCSVNNQPAMMGRIVGIKQVKRLFSQQAFECRIMLTSMAWTLEIMTIDRSRGPICQLYSICGYGPDEETNFSIDTSRNLVEFTQPGIEVHMTEDALSMFKAAVDSFSVIKS